MSVSAGSFVAGVGIVEGATFPLSDDLTVFAEINVDIASLVGFIPSLIVGVNYDL